MKMPFTVEQFFDVFKAYNLGIWPIQILAYALGFIAIFLAVKDGSIRDRMVALILGLFWIWMGAVYHLMYFAKINPTARMFGVFFIIEGLLLIFAGVIKSRLRFEMTASVTSVIGTVFMLYAIVIYQFLGEFFGHSFPRNPVFGAAPCPTTIFTFGILLWASKPVPIYVLVIPFLWSIVGFTAALSLQVPQDYGLAVAGVLGTILIVIQNRSMKRPPQHARQSWD